MRVWGLGPGFPFKPQNRAYFVPWAGRPGKEAIDGPSPAALQSASSITSSGSHPRKELQSPESGSEEGFPRDSWPPRSPARADSMSLVLTQQPLQGGDQAGWD